MVGFIRESSKQEEESTVNLKTSNCPESFRFDFEGYSSEFGGFSLASVEPVIDFDSVKDWIEEMQGPDSDQIGSEICVEGPLENEIGTRLADSVLGMDSVKIECRSNDGPVCSEDVIGASSSLVNSDDGMKDCSGDKIGANNSSIKSNDGMQDCCIDGFMEKTELDRFELAESNSDGVSGDAKTSHGDNSGIEALVDINSCKVQSLDCSIEEGLKKVTLISNEGDLIDTGSGMEKVGTPVVSEDNDIVSDSESESETSSSSASSSSESDDDEEEDEKEKEVLCEIKRESTKQTVDMEEGQIVDSDAENMVSWSKDNAEEVEDDDDKSDVNSEEIWFDDDVFADEDEDIVKGPIKSVNELKALPPVPPVNVTLQPCHQILPVGVVLSVLGAQVIVEGSEKHDPLSEGSILWIAEGRLPLGIVDEIFGPVKTPYYIVRYNSESEVPSGIETGTLVGFVLEFVGHVLNDKNLYQKGYDASGENDEEVLDELDFSDDEKEAEHKRLLKMSKRGNNNQGQGPGNKRKNNRSRGKKWTKDRPSGSQSPIVQPSQPTAQSSQPTAQSSQSRQMQQHMRPLVSFLGEGNRLGPSPNGAMFSSRPNVPSLSQGYQLGPCPFPMGPFFPRGPTPSPQQLQQFQQLQQAGILLNDLLANGIPFQQQNMAFPSGFQINGMPCQQQNLPPNFQVASASPTPWQQQQHNSQMPLANPAQCQQPFDFSPVGSGSSADGHRNFAAGPTNAPWVGMFGQNLSNQAPLNAGHVGQNLSNQVPQSPSLQGPSSQFPAQQGQNFNSQTPTSFRGNDGASSQFSQGPSSGRGGRGRGRKPFQQRGGRFGGGRGRQQPN